MFKKYIQIVERFSKTLMLSYLTDAEKEYINFYLYNRGDVYRKYDAHLWELEWFEREFEQLQTILIAACGAGREAKILQRMGHHIIAFDGAESMVADCQKRCQQREGIFQATFTNFLEKLFPIQVDAVLVGWGSIGHIFDVKDLVTFLADLRKSCVDGPILISFPITQHFVDPYLQGKVERSARWLTQVMSLGNPQRPVKHPYQSFNSTEGFLRCFTVEEIEECAAILGEVCSIELKPYARAVFRPKS